jgi:uncharacterized protein
VLRSQDGRDVGAPDILYWEDGRIVICDAKLAEKLDGKPEIALELTHYAHLLEDGAGLVPLRLEIVGGRGEVLEVQRVDETVYRGAVARARRLIGDGPEPDTLLSHSVCEGCGFYEHCWTRAEDEHRLQILPSVYRTHLARLASLGIRTLDDLAARDPQELERVSGIGRCGPPMVAEARAFLTHGPVWLGSPRLPSTRPRVWFDLEADTTDADHGVHVYLWGLAVDHGDDLAPEMIFSCGGEDRDADVWARFVTQATAWLDRYPQARWVHYANYERTWVKKYVERHGAPAGFEARLMRAMFDLHGEVIVPCLRLPLRAQGIKHVARFIGFAWSNPDAGSQWSIAQYRRARVATDAAERERRLGAIAEYNLDDLKAMRAVWDWIERHAPRH